MTLRERLFSAMEETFFKALRKGRDTIKREELKEKLDANDTGFLLDVRDPELFAAGHIQGTVNIPAMDLPDRVNELPKELDSPIIVICINGARSGLATMFLKIHGYSDVRNLNWGMEGWEDKDWPVVISL
ncbi:rhodanese-like domain-containing protein [Chloroflexota bacterium]